MPGPRWPAKREVAALWVLSSLGRRVDLGVAVEELRARLCITKRTARGIVKRLRRLGALRLTRGPDGRVYVEPLPPEEFLAGYVYKYLEWRRGRCRLP